MACRHVLVQKHRNTDIPHIFRNFQITSNLYLSGENTIAIKVRLVAEVAVQHIYGASIKKLKVEALW